MTQLPCITTSMRGRPCVIRDQHLEACLWAQCEAAAEVEGVMVGILLQAREQVGLPIPKPCRGCLPRPAVDGLLCDSCSPKWDAALKVVAALMLHLRSIQTGSRSVDGVRTAQGSKVIVPASWQAADQLWSLLSQVAIIHAGTPAKEPWWPAWVTVGGGGDQRLRRRLDGFAPTVTLDEVRAAAHELADWVTADAKVIIARHDSAEAAVELFRAVQTTLHRFPMEDTAVDLPRLRCRRCGMFAVRQHPPLHHLAEPVLECDVCGFEADPLLVDWDLKLYAQEVWEGMTPEQRAHLLPDLSTDEKRVLREFNRTELETIRADIWRRLGEVYTKEGRVIWFNAARAVWGGLNADEMIEAGRGHEVLRLIESAA